MNSPQSATLDEHPVRQYRVRQPMGTVYEVVQSTQSPISRSAFTVAVLLLFNLTALWGCDREPGIIVNIAGCPDGVERIRVRTTIEGTVGTDIFLKKDQTRFAVRVPLSSQGTVQLDAVCLDAMDCKLATGRLEEPVPDNLSRFVERTLELVPQPARSCIFATPINNFPVDMRPNSVAVGDFNGDMIPDLAVANGMSNNVSVLLGNGQGGFGSANSFNVGMSPSSVAVGDFDRDTKLDLAVVNFSSGDVSVLLGKGAGDFSAATNFPVGAQPHWVAVGDFDGDMKPDLAIANNNIRNGTNTVSVLLGDGEGGFGGAAYFPVGLDPRSVAVGDFNGDLNLDLAVANFQSDNSGMNTVTVLLGNGSGVFGAATNFSVGKSPISVAIGDFNGDRRPDLAVANAGDNNVSVLLSDGARGGFQTTANFPVGRPSGSIAVGDFNGDMSPDLAVTDNTSGGIEVRILLGDGIGGFRLGSNFVVGTSPTSVAVGYFNGDLKPDLAVVNYSDNNVSVLLNRF